ncbi:MAG TPA: hypothetical protein VIO80_14370 [Candidatus Dormibacteraeota bacterium]|jgi:hypothetical protein
MTGTDWALNPEVPGEYVAMFSYGGETNARPKPDASQPGHKHLETRSTPINLRWARRTYSIHSIHAFKFSRPETAATAANARSSGVFWTIGCAALDPVYLLEISQPA